ncbi:MAG: hypothetical protein PHN17_09140, partial [Syntrophaceticus sp.]|nr:hypothetical protein [Syntrophaceticus sp.]
AGVYEWEEVLLRWHQASICRQAVFYGKAACLNSVIKYHFLLLLHAIRSIFAGAYYLTGFFTQSQ